MRKLFEAAMRRSWHSGVLASASSFLVILTLAGCGSQGPWRNPAKDHNADPRAIEGTDPGLRLERALVDRGTALPANAKEVQFTGRNDLGPNRLDLTFVIPCTGASDSL